MLLPSVWHSWVTETKVDMRGRFDGNLRLMMHIIKEKQEKAYGIQTCWLTFILGQGLLGRVHGSMIRKARKQG